MMTIRRSFGLLATMVSTTFLAGAAQAAPPKAPTRPATAMHSTKVRVKDVAAHAAPSSPRPSAKGEPKKADAKADVKADVKADAKKEPSAKDKASGKAAKVAKEKAPCLRFPAMFARGTEERAFALTQCDGTPAPMAPEQLSVLARPDSAMRPPGVVQANAGGEVAPGVKRLDDRLVQRLQTMLDHFHKPGPMQKVRLVSGYRPASKGSFHATGAAIDFRIDGVSNEALVAFCKSLPDTGCGYYPNSTFIHMDVRSAGTGHVSWIDASGPGEPARYVAQWPPPPPAPADRAGNPGSTPMDRILPDLPQDEHPAAPSDMATTNDLDKATTPTEPADSAGAGVGEGAGAPL